MAKRELSPKRQRFVDLYTGECQGNAKEAYRRAGYACKNDHVAEASAHKLLRTAEVANAIAEATKETRSQAIADREERQEFLTRVIRGEETEQRIVTTKDGDPVAEEVPAPVSVRVKACEVLGKMHGDFVQRHEHTGANGGPIEFDGMSFDELMESARKRAGGDAP